MHGSHVAGIMLANKDDKGMHGIAYNANLAIGGSIDETTTAAMTNA